MIRGAIIENRRKISRQAILQRISYFTKGKTYKKVKSHLMLKCTTLLVGMGQITIPTTRP